jgi:hypothetical protein
VACSYCQTAYPGAPRGLSCPTCGDDNHPHNVACARCNGSLQRDCIFCGAASSIAVPACTRCGEAFAGARDRKAEREAAARRQQMMGIAATGVSVLGQAANSPTGRRVLNEVFQDLLRSAVKGS